MTARHGRVAKWLPRVILAGSLVLATSPTWRVLMLGDSPTLEELLRLICATRTQAS